MSNELLGDMALDTLAARHLTSVEDIRARLVSGRESLRAEFDTLVGAWRPERPGGQPESDSAVERYAANEVREALGRFRLWRVSFKLAPPTDVTHTVTIGARTVEAAKCDGRNKLALARALPGESPQYHDRLRFISAVPVSDSL